MSQLCELIIVEARWWVDPWSFIILFSLLLCSKRLKGEKKTEKEKLLGNYLKSEQQ